MDEERQDNRETNDENKKENDEFFDFILGRKFKKPIENKNQPIKESINRGDAWILGRAHNEESTLESDQQKTVNNIQDFLEQIDVDLLFQNIDMLKNSANELKPLVKKLSPLIKKWID